MINKIWIGFCWFCVGSFSLGFVGGILMYFTEPDVSFTESVIAPLMSLFLAYIFYKAGPHKNGIQKKEEMKSIAERAKEEKRKEKIKNKEAELIQEMLEMVSNNSDYELVEGKMGAIDYLKNSKDYKDIQNFIANSKTSEKEVLEKTKLEKAEAIEQKRLQKRVEHEKELHELCINEDEWKSFKNSKICIGMHMLLVKDMKGKQYDEKRNESADKITLKYKYGRYENQRGNWSYELEVTFENDRVTAFKDL